MDTSTILHIGSNTQIRSQDDFIEALAKKENHADFLMRIENGSLAAFFSDLPEGNDVFGILNNSQETPENNLCQVAKHLNIPHLFIAPRDKDLEYIFRDNSTVFFSSGEWKTSKPLEPFAKPRAGCGAESAAGGANTENFSPMSQKT